MSSIGGRFAKLLELRKVYIVWPVQMGAFTTRFSLFSERLSVRFSTSTRDPTSKCLFPSLMWPSQAWPQHCGLRQRSRPCSLIKRRASCTTLLTERGAACTSIVQDESVRHILVQLISFAFRYAIDVDISVSEISVSNCTCSTGNKLPCFMSCKRGSLDPSLQPSRKQFCFWALCLYPFSKLSSMSYFNASPALKMHSECSQCFFCELYRLYLYSMKHSSTVFWRINCWNGMRSSTALQPMVFRSCSSRTRSRAAKVLHPTSLPFPEKAVMVTVDDGHMVGDDVVENAGPVMQASMYFAIRRL